MVLLSISSPKAYSASSICSFDTVDCRRRPSTSITAHSRALSSTGRPSSALHPYPDDLVIVTKVGALRGPSGSVHPAMGREQLIQAVHDNLRNLGVEALDVVNLRSMLRDDGPAEGSLEEPLSVMADLQRQGLIRHVGLSNVTEAQVTQGRSICEIVCVQNLYSQHSC